MLNIPDQIIRRWPGWHEKNRRIFFSCAWSFRLNMAALFSHFGENMVCGDFFGLKSFLSFLGVF